MTSALSPPIPTTNEAAYAYVEKREQSEAFKREVQRLIDAGELSPTEAESVLERMLRSSQIIQPNDRAAKREELHSSARSNSAK